MCYACGCNRPYDTMGDPKNVTEPVFEEAGQTEALERAGKVTAKRNMLRLLQMELERGELEQPQQQY